MTEKTRKTILLAYGSVLGAFTVTVGALLIWQVLSLYFAGTASDFAGKQIFTRENVGAALGKIAPALWIWLALAAIGFGVGVACETARKVGRQDVRYTLFRLKKRLPKSGAPEGSFGEAAKIVRREETVIKILWLCCGAVAVASAAYAVAYLAIPENFPSRLSKENVTAEIITMVKHFIPCVTWTFLFACCIGIYERISAKKQIPEVKRLSAAYRSGEIAPPENGQAKRGLGAVLAIKARNGKFFSFASKTFEFFAKHGKTVARAAVGCLAVSFIIAGIFNGGARDVLIKAVNICTECIGLG
ncbi:CD1871A family CXXC motif-containing protein [Pumilibacter muris]|uniref:CD1871A family CXXC motif-containing protein n=1 Tax=Pumilibacter muris TaxID=2941510 RepID=UPI00308439D2